MARRTKAAPEPFDRELAELPADLRWREWMGRVEAAIFASPTPVSSEGRHAASARVIRTDGPESLSHRYERQSGPAPQPAIPVGNYQSGAATLLLSRLRRAG